MKQADIDVLAVDDTMPAAKQRLRRQAPRYIASVINDSRVLRAVTSLDELRPEHLQALSGGVDAATYLLSTPQERVVIKLSYHGLAAEAEAIAAWRQRGVRVPKIVGVGVVPITKDDRRPIYYLVQEVLVDQQGRLVETCAHFLTREPSAARSIGRMLGRELTKLHRAVTDRRFGQFSDSEGSQSNYQSWNSYMIDCIRADADFLCQNGAMSADEQVAVEQVIGRRRYVTRGRYLHGDFSIRNMAVKSYQPLKVSVFDPNPLVGDPSWDISFLKNNYEFAKRRQAYDDSQADLAVMYQQLWIGFKQGYGRAIHDDNVVTAQLVQGIYQAMHAESIGDRVGLRVRREFLRDTVAALTKL